MASAPRTERQARFDAGCTLCPRLAAHLAETRSKWPHYHAKPVPPFGPLRARLQIVGLAPGLHGANRTGRPFTGDGAGALLYATLYKHGLCTERESSHRRDGLRLLRCRVTNAVKCLPPQNRPTGDEIKRCNQFLRAELAAMTRTGVILALGRIAHDAVLRALGLRAGAFPFSHGREFELNDGRWLIDSYHCSRYNTQTRRLTEDMFNRVVARAAELAFD